MNVLEAFLGTQHTDALGEAVSRLFFRLTTAEHGKVAIPSGNRVDQAAAYILIAAGLAEDTYERETRTAVIIRITKAGQQHRKILELQPEERLTSSS